MNTEPLTPQSTVLGIRVSTIMDARRAHYRRLTFPYQTGTYEETMLLKAHEQLGPVPHVLVQRKGGFEIWRAP